MGNHGTHGSFRCRVHAQAATPEPSSGGSIHHPDLSPAVPFLEQEGFAFISRAGRDDVNSAVPASQDMHRGSKRKPHCSRWQMFLRFCIITFLRLQGSEHKPVQPHCSHSPLANSWAITLLCSCCSQDRSAAPLKPLGSSNPFPTARKDMLLPAPAADLNHGQALAENMDSTRGQSTSIKFLNSAHIAVYTV